MRIVHFFRSPVGGIFRHVRDLLNEQSANGHDVGIICDSKTGGDYEDRLFEKIAPQLSLGLHRIPMARSISPVDVLTLMKARRLIAEIKPDVVHTHSAKGGIHGRLAGKLASSGGHPVKTFYCPHGGAMHYDAGSLKGKVFFAAERFMERYTNSLIFVSEYERDAYHGKVGQPTCPEAVVYNGLPDDEFMPVKTEKDSADFLYIGMMRDLKGPDVFLKALNHLHKNGNGNLTAMFVGDGPDKPKYIDMIGKSGMGAFVSVHDAMPAREAFAKAKIVVVPSRAESMPYLVLEAIAAQKPVVATNVGGIPEIFEGRSAELVEPDNVAALADRMLAVYDDKTRTRKAKAFADDLRSRFSLPVMASGMERLYRS